ncbi:SIS domain-containing protein [Pelagibacteraceae bacterium]|nr:SIS domain-containing protein [Pelagibacteraceae bacterium]
MKKSSLVKISDHIPSFLCKSSKTKKNKSLVIKYLDKTLQNLEKNKNVFHMLSNDFYLEIDKKKLKKYEKYKTVIVIGMGGSTLGAEAIYQLFKNKIKKKFIFFNNLNVDKTKDLLKIKKKNDLFFIIISKSGNTIETLVNISLFAKLNINSLNSVIITEKVDNALSNFAKKKKIYTIEHKKYIGGRYSVLSEVGMIPAFFMKLKIKNFRTSLLKYLKSSDKEYLAETVSKMSQIYLSKKVNSIIFLNYCPRLENFLYWSQQLIAESLGKNKKGLLPLVSSAPKDHHSLLQLYLDGPKDKIFYIFTNKNKSNLKIKKNIFGKNFKFIKNKKVETIVKAQSDSVKRVLKAKKIPFKDFEFNEFSEESLGGLFSYFILETIMIGKLLKINPFNQPAVEQVKILTKKNLS